MTHEERCAFGLRVHQARYRMRLSRDAFSWAFKSAFPNLPIRPYKLALIENGADCEPYKAIEYVAALSNFCGIAAPEHQDMTTIGLEIRKARESKNLSRLQVVDAFKAAYPGVPMSYPSLKRIELHGLASEKMISSMCEFLGVSVAGKTEQKVAPVAAEAPKAAPPPAAVPEADSLFGFSIVEARNTLRQLKGMGLPTEQVKQAMIQKFTDYVNTLDK